MGFDPRQRIRDGLRFFARFNGAGTDWLRMHSLDAQSGCEWLSGGGVRLRSAVQAYLQSPKVSFLAQRPGEGISIAGWVSLQAIGTRQCIVSRYGDTSVEWSLDVLDDGRLSFEVWSFVVATGAPDAMFSVIVPGLGTDDEHFVFAQYDGSHLMAQVDDSEPVAGDAFSGDVGARYSTCLQVGRQAKGGGRYYADLTLNGLGIWTRYQSGLDTNEIAYLRRRGKQIRRLPRPHTAPIVSVARSVHHPEPDYSGAVSHYEYRAGPVAELLRIHSGDGFQSDSLVGVVSDISLDDGETFGEEFSFPDSAVVYAGVATYESSFPSPFIHDLKSGLLVGPWQRQFFNNAPGLVNNYTYMRTSADRGKTWSTPVQLRYEAGDDFDPADPLAAGFLLKNQASPGGITRLSNGDLLAAVGSARSPTDPDNDTRRWKMGACFFRGRWDGSGYTWTPSNLIGVDPSLSIRGLLEPAVAELRDGRILVVYRMDNRQLSATTPSIRYYAISEDGGATLSGLSEFAFADGGRAWAPSSTPYLWRRPSNGKLYFLGNLAPPIGTLGDSPRYPLVFCEVDETVPGLKRETLTEIDDREITQPSAVQFSNFAFVQNHGRDSLRMFLTPLGIDPLDANRAGVFRYDLAFRH
jgi:hypothetical protein